MDIMKLLPILSSQAGPDPLSIETTFPEAAFVLFVIDSSMCE
jgi:hypothetical protein